MINALKNINRSIEYEREAVADIESFIKQFDEHSKIELFVPVVKQQKEVFNIYEKGIIQVFSYMTKNNNPKFSFHDKYNKGKVMPMEQMQYELLEENDEMIKIKCKGVAFESDRCIVCGNNNLKQPIKSVGLCGKCCKNLDVVIYSTEQEMLQHIDEVDKILNKIKWSGWVLKKSIIEVSQLEE